MDGWAVEGRHIGGFHQEQKSFSQSSSTTTTTRIFHHQHHQQNLRVSTNLLQGNFSNVMSNQDWPQMTNHPSSLASASLLLKKKMENMSFDDGPAASSALVTLGNEPASGLSSIDSFFSSPAASLKSSLASEGLSLTSSSATTKAFLAEQRQVFAASSLRSTSGQERHSQIAEIKAACASSTSSVGQVVCDGGSNSASDVNNTLLPSSFLNMSPLIASTGHMNMLNVKASLQQQTTTQMSASSSMGVTRSFSSSSGFLPSSSSTLFSDKSGSTETGLQSSTGDLVPSLESFVSPFKRAPFNFRNFHRPLWTDMKDNRMTWDPALLLKSSASQIQFSASQQTFLEASTSADGQSRVRAFKDQRVMLRQSYGASESESDNDDDDDDDYGVRKSIEYKARSALPYQPKLAITCKPHYEPSESDDVSIIAPSETDTEGYSPRDSGVTIEELPVTPEHKKCFKVAHELLTTERTYVKILHLIDQVFHFRVDQENRVQTMFSPEIITQMFCNIKSLYQLHHDHLLPQLEKRLANWEDDPRIGDIMKDFAPFLKMYSEYVQNFDNSINLINLYREKNVRFMNIINEIQKMEECGNLPIQHHLIGPIQRIPRYRLLLEAYLRRLPEDSEDKPDTEKALEIVSKAAEHANEAMRRIASFKKLLEVQENVKGVVDLVSPTRTLVKEGKISKISARTGDHQERYVFLFSDVILLCSVRPMANRMISNAPYQLRARLDVSSVTVAEGDDLEVMNTFYVEDSHKKIELYTDTPSEKEEWMTAVHNAKEELIERKSSLRLGSISPTEDELGIKEPTKLKSDSVSKCMECYTSFTMLKRRHHCHACGSVVCAKCSESKLPLQYRGGKSSRVCKRCKTVLLDKLALSKKSNESEQTTPDDSAERLRGVLDVPANVPAVLNGYLSLRMRGRKEWTNRWFTLRTDFVLYCYEKETDERAMTATPIPGMSILLVEDLPKPEVPNVASSEKERVFRIAHNHGHGRKSFVFLAQSRADAVNWVRHLKQAAKAELVDCPPNNNNSPEKKVANSAKLKNNATIINNQP